MIDVDKFLEYKSEEIARLCRPKFLEAVKNGREKEYYEEIKVIRKIDPLYDYFLKEIEAWIK